MPATTYAAPATYAAPMTYAAPATYAAPMTSYAAPTTYAAPMTSYAAPTTTFAQPVAAPQVQSYNLEPERRVRQEAFTVMDADDATDEDGHAGAAVTNNDA